MWLRVGVCVSVCVCMCTDSYLIHFMIVTLLAVVIILRLLCVGPNQFLVEKKMYMSSYNRLHTIGYSVLRLVKRSCLVWGTRASFSSQNRVLGPISVPSSFSLTDGFSLPFLCPWVCLCSLSRARAPVFLCSGPASVTAARSVSFAKVLTQHTQNGVLVHNAALTF